MFNKHIASTMEEIGRGLTLLNEDQAKQAVKLVRKNKRIVICSMGKPAFACAKTVYTAHSFGLDWVELDATHALHGDIGILKPNDLIIIVSKSGETKETNEVAHFLHHHGYTTLAITSGNKSELTEWCDHKLIIPVGSECSPFGFAPMASTTIYMIVLHALLCEAIDAEGVTLVQYAKNHSAGKIGEDIRKSAL